MTPDGKILFKHERLKPTIIRTCQGNVKKFGSAKADYDYQSDT